MLDAAGIEHTTPTALPVLDDERAELFGWVVREAVTNVVRHSGATHCTITCTEHSITVSDDGHGLGAGRSGPWSPQDSPGGSGFVGLRARVSDAGGSLVLDSRPGHGTTLTATLPLSAPLTVPTSQESA